MSDKILKFSAEWCMPCKMLEESLQAEPLSVEVEEVDVDANRDLAIEYSIRSVPTLVYIKEGREIARVTGAKSVAELQKWVDNIK